MPHTPLIFNNEATVACDSRLQPQPPVAIHSCCYSGHGHRNLSSAPRILGDPAVLALTQDLELSWRVCGECAERGWGGPGTRADRLRFPSMLGILASLSSAPALSRLGLNAQPRLQTSEMSLINTVLLSRGTVP